MQKATRGQSLVATPIGSAGFQNTLVDIVDWWRQNALGKGRASNPSSTPTDVIKVKNITGSDRQAGQVLEVGTPLLTTLDRRRLWFNADAISHATRRSYCILKRPIPSGEIDEAHISGGCVAKVDIQATTDRYAYVEASSYNLKSGSNGQFRLLGPLTSTGVQDVAVIFSEAAPPSYFRSSEGGFGLVAGTMLDCTFGDVSGNPSDVAGEFTWSHPELTWNGAEGTKAKVTISCRMATGGTPTSSEWFTVALVQDYPAGFPTSLGDEGIVFAIGAQDKTLLQPLCSVQRLTLHNGAKYRLRAQRILGSGGTISMNISRTFLMVETYP